MFRHPAFDGLYTPQDSLWKVNRELFIMAAGPRALLMELAHPLVARGVVEHSHFAANPLKRLFNTMRVMQLLSFGTRGGARLAAKHNHDCHTHVHGEGYDASDPALRLWVFATLVDSILVAHDEFIRPLAIAEKSVYYEDSKRMAPLLGVPLTVMPRTFGDFNGYVANTLADGTLSVGDDSRKVIAALFDQPLFGRAARIAAFYGVGLLPAAIREAYGFHWTDRAERNFQAWSRLARRLRASLPEPLVTQPMAWLTYYRWRTSNQES